MWRNQLCTNIKINSINSYKTKETNQETKKKKKTHHDFFCYLKFYDDVRERESLARLIKDPVRLATLMAEREKEREEQRRLATEDDGVVQRLCYCYQ